MPFVTARKCRSKLGSGWRLEQQTLMGGSNYGWIVEESWQRVDRGEWYLVTYTSGKGMERMEGFSPNSCTCKDGGPEWIHAHGRRNSEIYIWGGEFLLRQAGLFWRSMGQSEHSKAQVFKSRTLHLIQLGRFEVWITLLKSEEGRSRMFTLKSGENTPYVERDERWWAVKINGKAQ